MLFRLKRSIWASRWWASKHVLNCQHTVKGNTADRKKDKHQIKTNIKSLQYGLRYSGWGWGYLIKAHGSIQGKVVLTIVDLFIYSGASSASSFDSPPGSHADPQGSANICAFPAREEIMPMTTCRLHSASLAPPHFAVLRYLHFDQSKVCRCRRHFQFQALPQRLCLWRVSSFDTCLLLAWTPNDETQVDPETRVQLLSNQIFYLQLCRFLIE